GADIRTNPKQTKKQIGFLPENNPLYTDMYVQEFLGFAAQLYQVQTTRVQEVIELVGLQPERNKKIGQLSKGYRQRVGLAHAILHEPELLILDEPTNGLDPNQILEIRSVIREIGRHKTVLLSTHLMQEVEALCTRVILLHKGSVIQDTSIEDFRGKYESLEQAFATYTN
ncbi:MAG TPA: multidrug ABC transporter ATP-binding protein, partial [Chryseobacterium sp.]|nr:multidrug ABC transporter ATP-binding protein [Chryseobacterium sp.]